MSTTKYQVKMTIAFNDYEERQYTFSRDSLPTASSVVTAAKAVNANPPASVKYTFKSEYYDSEDNSGEFAAIKSITLVNSEEEIVYGAGS